MKSRLVVCVAGLSLLLACSDNSSGPGQPAAPWEPKATPSIVTQWFVPFDASDIGVSDNGIVYLPVWKSGFLRYSPSGFPDGNWTPTSESGDDLRPYYVAFANHRLYVVASTPQPARVVVFDSDQARVDEWTEKYDPASWGFPAEQIAVDDSGSVYRLSTDEESVVKYRPNGEFEREWLTHGTNPALVNQPGGIVVGPNHVVYVSDLFNDRILKFTTDGAFLGEFGTHGSADGQFINPVGLAIDGYDVLYVVDALNMRVQKFTLDGEYLAQFPARTSVPIEVGGRVPQLIAIHGNAVYVLLHHGYDKGLVEYFRYR